MSTLRFASRFGLCGPLLASLLLASSALAVPVNYGDFGPDLPLPGTTIYQSVTESSGTDPLPPAHYGPPSLTDDTLDFNPKEFVASGISGGSDILDGQLNFTLASLPLTGITSLFVGESGDYSLDGPGTATTRVTSGLSVDIDILEVDGVALASPLPVFVSSTFAANLVAPGPVILAPWSNGVLVDFGPVLSGAGIMFDLGVTRAEVVINNQLLAFSEANTVAFIAKKDFTVTPAVEVDPNFVPEPTSLALALAALGFVGLRRQG